MEQKNRLVPDPLHAKVHVKTELPPEASEVLSDLHAARHAIGTGLTIATACLVALTMRKVFKG